MYGFHRRFPPYASKKPHVPRESRRGGGGGGGGEEVTLLPQEAGSGSRSKIKVFRYSFSEVIPIFFNRLKSVFFLV